uniref:Oculocutaneous albinism II n=1 Tax=Mus musculus TaxID=10090 RepID=D6RIQ8_MOUSE
MRLENKDIRLASAVLEVELHQTSALSVPTCPDPGRLLTVKPATSNYKLGQADPCIPYAGEAAGKSVCVPEHTEFGSFLVKGSSSLKDLSFKEDTPLLWNSSQKKRRTQCHFRALRTMALAWRVLNTRTNMAVTQHM